MAVKSSGSLSFNTDIVGEFGGSTPHSLSEYYRGGDNVPSAVTDIPSSGAIDFSDFYGTSNALTVTYHVVGAGGGGGGAGRTDSAATGGTGGSTSVSGSGITTITATGGGGGTGGLRVSGVSGGDTVNAGGAGVTIGGVERGAGGDSAFNQGGGDDTEHSGGGGGGAGGAGTSGGGSDGTGGAAAQYHTGTFTATVGTVLTITIGTGGARGLNYLNNDYAGGYSGNDNAQAGDDGFVRLTIDGTDHDFTSSGTHTV
ncbi:MAG: hypothetical protein ACPF8W_00035 [Luminiphilus sp.]